MKVPLLVFWNYDYLFFFYMLLYFDSIQLVLSSFYATDAIARWFSLWLLLSRKDHHHLPWWGFQSQRFWSSSFTKNVYVLHSLLLALLCWVMASALCDKIYPVRANKCVIIFLCRNFDKTCIFQGRMMDSMQLLACFISV